MPEANPSTQLINKIELVLSKYLEADALLQTTNYIVRLFYDYEIKEKTTEIVPYNDYNSKTIEYYSGCMVIDGKSPKTIKYYLYNLKRFFDCLGNKNCKEVTAYDIRYFLASEKTRGLSSSTIENERATLSAFFQWLTNEDIIPKNPVAKISTIKCTQKVRSAFSDIEIDAMRSACKKNKERALIEFLLSSGARVSEASNIMISDINEGKMSVHIRNGKGGKDRITYITPLCLNYIKKYLAERTDDSPYLFINLYGERLMASGIRKVLSTVAKRANVQNVHPHRFRRTFATGLSRNGMNVQYIKNLLGHANINTTMRYICNDENDLISSYKTYMH